MFAEFAPRVREKGWQSPIPLRPGLKRPAIVKWQVFNKRPPTEAEFAKWMLIYWNYGVGLAFGLDNVVGIDLDWTHPPIAARAWDITRSTLGDTPLVRIGRPPKKLALYRCDPGFVAAKVYGSFELFTRSGQCVIFGIHPDTGQPYSWLADTPATLGPADLPLATRDQLYALIDELEHLDPETTARRRTARGVKKPGITTEILRTLKDVEDAPAETARILARTPVGRRHDTMIGAVTALAMRGYSDRVIRDALDSVFCGLMDDSPWETSDAELEAAIKWAREQVGADDETVARDLPPALASISAVWNGRWGRS